MPARTINICNSLHLLGTKTNNGRSHYVASADVGESVAIWLCTEVMIINDDFDTKTAT